jgi:hypothetical protein
MIIKNNNNQKLDIDKNKNYPIKSETDEFTPMFTRVESFEEASKEH